MLFRSDSGIDTTPCMPAPPPLPLTIPDVDPVEIVPRSDRGQTGFPWALEYQEEEEREGHREKMLLTQGHVSASAVGHATDGSTGNLSEISSLSRYSGEEHTPHLIRQIQRKLWFLDLSVSPVLPLKMFSLVYLYCAAGNIFFTFPTAPSPNSTL